MSEDGRDDANNKGWTRDYIWLGGKPIAQIKSKFKADGSVKDQEISYIHTDHLNTPRVATNQDQEVVWRWDSDAFGEQKAQRDVDQDGKKVKISLRFPGQYFDQESKLHYNHHRDYDPKIGRYVQSDPIGLFGGVNRYSYVGGNPLTRSDPKGQDWVFNNDTGTLTQIDASGVAVQTWPATSGPFGNGALPLGNYGLTSTPQTVPSSNSSQASYTDGAGNSWWLAIDPQFGTSRFGFGIHPDGGQPGTAGCVGITCNDTTSSATR